MGSFCAGKEGVISVSFALNDWQKPDYCSILLYMKPLRIAINGFGRIGRAAFRVALNHKDIEVAAINDLTDTGTLAHLLKHDSVYRRFEGEISFDEKNLVVNGKKYPVSAEKEPTKLPWRDHRVDVVLECTGRFTKEDAARAPLDAGAKRIVASAPTKGGET